MSFTSTPKVRPAIQAGRFYEGDPLELKNEVDHYLSRHADITCHPNVAALIVPHAGYYYSGNVAATAYMTLDKAKEFKRIFLIGPSHIEWTDGASVDANNNYYDTPLGRVKVDCDMARQLIEADEVFNSRESVFKEEHCLEVQLPFLLRRLDKMPAIVPIIVSTNDYSKLRRIAEVLKPFFNEDNLFVISSDFSHYPSYEDANIIDGKTGEAIMSGDAEEFIATLMENGRSGVRNLSTSACGAYAIITLLLMLDKTYSVEHILYQNSGDIDRHGGHRVVGYHSFAILRGEKTDKDMADFILTEKEKAELKRIAFESIETAFNDKKAKESDSETYPILNKKCGAFVTLTKHGRLRGCIGHFGEDSPLHEIVAEMARAAAFEDPRFPQLSREELNDVEIEISVLTPMRRIGSLDEFQLHRHGIYIKKGWRSGTYLPQVADEVNWTKEEFVSHCSHDKAGLGWDGWRDAELYVYEAIVF